MCFPEGWEDTPFTNFHKTYNNFHKNFNNFHNS